MKRFILIVFLLGLSLPGRVFAQAMIAGSAAEGTGVPNDILPAYRLGPAEAALEKNEAADVPIWLTSEEPRPSTQVLTAPKLDNMDELPVMSPELTLATYQHRIALQAAELAAYSAVMVVRAELPDTSQQGEFELQRKFEAPHTLQFTPVHYSGDNFVKSNVITRLLQSEVDHVLKDDPSQTAISLTNYKFSYKGASRIQDRLVHVYQVKPHKKRLGLFKGRVYLDARTGSLVRAEGSVVKSPSFFVKHIEFWQDYTDVQSFTLPAHIHSEARARIVGRTIVDITHRDYQAAPAATTQSARQVPAM